MEAKVSLISPCYNGAEFLHKFFESLVLQDYANVEFIFINDGSTDDTAEIFQKFRLPLEKKGWSVKYIYQENKGQAAAVNQGLKIFTGEYLIYPDSDDILYPDHIREKVNFMEMHPECGIAYCVVDICNIENCEKITGEMRKVPDDKMFEHIIEDNGSKIMWPPIGNIIRSSALLDVVPSRKIPECSGGQNCQIQLPLLRKYACGFIDKSLGKYVVRNNSHSRTADKKIIKRSLSLAKTWIDTIIAIPDASIKEKSCLILKVISRHFNFLGRYYTYNIFSVKNQYSGNKKYKVITILGIKIKLKVAETQGGGYS